MRVARLLWVLRGAVTFYVHPGEYHTKKWKWNAKAPFDLVPFKVDNVQKDVFAFTFIIEIS